MGTIAILILIFQLCASIPIDDPSAWPGHLETFGSKQKTVNIDIHYEWPSPEGESLFFTISIFIYFVVFFQYEEGINIHFLIIFS